MKTEVKYPCSDPKEAELREAWHRAKSAENFPEFEKINTALATYLWSRAQRDIEEDRRRHPKAKRNAPVEFNREKTRALP